MESDPEHGRLFFNLKVAQSAMRAALDDALDDLGISGAQMLILHEIERSQAISAADLARFCAVSPQAMVTSLSRLEAAGLIVRTPAPSGRSIETHLTEKGATLFESAISRARVAERYVVAALGDETVEALSRDLQRLTDCLAKSVVVTTSRSWDDNP